MSRSRKKTPIHGNTCTESDKPYKVQEHRRERRAVRSRLLDDESLPPSPKEFGNPWKSGKDGKSHWPSTNYKAYMK
jgi:hypothetical protein